MPRYYVTMKDKAGSTVVVGVVASNPEEAKKKAAHDAVWASGKTVIPGEILEVEEDETP